MLSHTPTCLSAYITVQVSRPVATSQAMVGLATVYSYLKNIKFRKDVEADLFLPEAQMKTNKLELSDFINAPLKNKQTNKPEL